MDLCDAISVEQTNAGIGILYISMTRTHLFRIMIQSKIYPPESKEKWDEKARGMAPLWSRVPYCSARKVISAGDQKRPGWHHHWSTNLTVLAVWASCLSCSKIMVIPVMNWKVGWKGSYQHDPQLTTGRTNTGRCCHYWRRGGWDGILLNRSMKTLCCHRSGRFFDLWSWNFCSIGILR